MSTLSRQVRSVLEALPDAVSLAELLVLVDDFVVDCSSSAESGALLLQLESELQAVHQDVVAHSSLYQTEVFLAVLYHLCPVLSAASIISTWHDLVLRPALREPKLPTVAVNHAKELIVSALHKSDESYAEKVEGFRRHLLDLYLLDAFNDGSGVDVLEWEKLDEEQKETRIRWKSNLEDVLLRFAVEQPKDLLTEVHNSFHVPSSRLQLLILLDMYTSRQSFPSSAAVLATHPLMTRLLLSILLDHSSTVCTIGLNLLVKLLPIFAVHACADLKGMIPQLLAILARLMCWKEVAGLLDSGLQEIYVLADAEIGTRVNRALHVRPDVDWQRLESIFDVTAPSAPSPHTYFTILYYLFPCNVLKFLRGPVAYLTSRSLECPYTVSWEGALDNDEIRSKSEPLLRGHICHPLIIWRDAEAELIQPDFWAEYDVPRIVSESMMLEVRNAVVGLRERQNEDTKPNLENISKNTPTPRPDEGGSITDPTTRIITLTSSRPCISLQDMITTSVALKSNLDVEILKPSSPWPSALFSATPSEGNVSIRQELTSSSGSEIPSHVTRAISGLQREVLLLRNELNFELWLSKENVKHIGRLYQNRVLSKNAEAERQGLFNKLRKYRAQVLGLERELKDQKEQASSAKNKYTDWNTELQKKLREFREEKKAWIFEAATLRTAEKEAQARFAVQGTLLAEATREVFELQTRKKEVQHKIDRLRDYERQIEQHVKIQRLWDEDFRQFNERAEDIERMKGEYRQMQMRLESYEHTQAELEENGRGYRRQIQALEARLSLVHRKSDASRQMPAAQMAAFASEKLTLSKANSKLREENADLRDEVEEMKAMVELLKGQVSGRRGLVSEPRSSPQLFI